MSLAKPPEPVEIKARIAELYRSLSKELGSGALGLAVWSGSIFARYLWEYWGPELRRQGFSWPRFLSFLKAYTGLIGRWALEGNVSWEELVEHITAGLTGREKRGLDQYLF